MKAESKTETRAHAERLRALSRRLVNAQEDERRRLTRELHDRVGPSLTALNIILNRLAQALPKRVPDRTRRDLRESLDLVEATAESIEDVMLDLRVPLLDHQGLVPALRWYAMLFSRRTGIPTTVTGEEPAPRLEREVATALFRIAQEALNNIARHARARNARIALDQEKGGLTLTVADDGAGFAPARIARESEPARCGIPGMRERAQAVGGELRIDSNPGAGTSVTIQLGRA